MKLQVGDNVKFLDTVGEGVILSFIDDLSVFVRDGHGFESKHLLKELVLVTADEYGEKVMYKGGSVKKKKTELIREKNTSVLEVDLHMHELRDSYRNMTNFEIVQYQLTIFDNKMGHALRNGIHKVVFIHGVGEGVLRGEIRDRLQKDYASCEYHDASYKRYGGGATEVIIRGER